MKALYALTFLALIALLGLIFTEVLAKQPPTMAAAPTDAHDHSRGHDHEHDHDHGHAAEANDHESRDPNRLWCGEHGVYEDECAICHPELAGTLAPGQGLKLRLPSTNGLEKAGVTTGRPAASEPGGALRLAARVAYNAGRLAQVTARVPGVVESVAVEIGDSVREGQTLAELASTDVSEARSAYAQAVAEESLAKATYDREAGLVQKGISPRKDLERDEADLRAAQARTLAARQSLRNQGIAEGDSGSRLAVRAPFSGTVIDRSAVAGEAVNEGAALFTVADLSSLWLELAIPENRLASVNLGDALRARFEALPGLSFDAELAWLDSKVDPQTRTVKGRASIPNPNGILKDGMFGHVELTAAPSEGVRLPSAAVQEFDGKPFVFVKLENDLYELREVALGRRDADAVQVLDGLQGEEEIVLARSYTLKSELLKSRLGAGCADH